MAKYIHLFQSASTFETAYNGEDYNEPWLSYTKDVEHVDYNKLKNWIRVVYSPDTCAASGYGIETTPDYDSAFDNSENSTYILYNECADVETVVKGELPYWDKFCRLSIGQPEDWDDYWGIDSGGPGEWEIVRHRTS